MPNQAALAATALLIAVTPLTSHPAHAGAVLRCGDVVTRNITLTADLIGCPGNGIVAGASDITIDLAGHLIGSDGLAGESGPDAGVLVADHAGVDIRGGTIRGFDVGVLISSSQGVVVSSIVLDSSRYVGALGRSTIRSTFIGNTVISSDLNAEGLNLDGGSSLNLMSGNRVSGAELAVLVTGNRNRLTGNTIQDSRGGFVIIGNRNLVAGNRVRNLVGCPPDQCGIGVSVEGGNDNIVVGNTLTNTHDMGIRVDAYVGPAERTVIVGNVVDRPGSVGIAVAHDQVGSVTGTIVSTNHVQRAAGDGIAVDDAGAAVGGNQASLNGELGIRAVPGARDAGGNRAWANGDRAQCSPTIVCRPAR